VRDSSDRLGQIKSELDKQNIMLVNYRNQQLFLKEELHKIQTIFLRQDIGQEKKFLWGSTFRFNSVIGMEELEFMNSTILIIRAETNDDTIRGYINNNNSLVPKSIELMQSCTLDIVLYNNALNYKSPELLTIELQYNIDKRTLHISCSSKINFKLLIYTMVNFDQTCAAQILEEHFSKNGVECETKIGDLQNERELIKLHIEKSTRVCANNEKRINENQYNLELKEKELEVKIESYYKQIDAIFQQIENNVGFIQSQSPGTSEEVTMVQTIGKILRDNNLETELIELMHNYSNKLNDLLHEFSEQKLKLKQLRDLKNTFYFDN